MNELSSNSPKVSDFDLAKYAKWFETEFECVRCGKSSLKIKDTIGKMDCDFHPGRRYKQKINGQIFFFRDCCDKEEDEKGCKKCDHYYKYHFPHNYIVIPAVFVIKGIIKLSDKHIKDKNVVMLDETDIDDWESRFEVWRVMNPE